MSSKNNKKILWAFIWIAIGVIWIMANYGILPISFTWSKDWPVIFIIIGIATLCKLITCRVSAEKKRSCTVNYGNNVGSKSAGGRAKWLKIRVYEDDAETPKVKVTLPLSVIRSAIKIGGKFNVSMPESAKEKMAEKGINFNAEMFENIDELFDELAVNGRYDIVNVVDEDEGERVEVFVE